MVSFFSRMEFHHTGIKTFVITLIGNFHNDVLDDVGRMTRHCFHGCLTFHCMISSFEEMLQTASMHHRYLPLWMSYGTTSRLTFVTINVTKLNNVWSELNCLLDICCVSLKAYILTIYSMDVNPECFLFLFIYNSLL